jgi:hypothetical protein
MSGGAPTDACAPLRDDPRIPDEEALYRSIHPTQVSGGEPTSAAFRGNRDEHLSVDRAALARAEETLARHPGHAGIAAILAGQAREHTPGVAWQPLPVNGAHALILRDLRLGSSRDRRVARKLAKACSWAIAPSDEDAGAEPVA